jgi:hypothetical protein
MWEQIEDWEVVYPLLPVITVEGNIVWFKRCERRILRNDMTRERLRQYRVLPVSNIWMDAR